MKSRVSLVLSLLLALPLVAIADYEAGVDAYVAGEHTKALTEFLPLAEQGEHKAQYSLGWLYERGHGVEKDLVQAYTWFGLAGNGGHPEASVRMLAIEKVISPEQLAQAQQNIVAFLEVTESATSLPMQPNESSGDDYTSLDLTSSNDPLVSPALNSSVAGEPVAPTSADDGGEDSAIAQGIPSIFSAPNGKHFSVPSPWMLTDDGLVGNPEVLKREEAPAPATDVQLDQVQVFKRIDVSFQGIQDLEILRFHTPANPDEERLFEDTSGAEYAKYTFSNIWADGFPRFEGVPLEWNGNVFQSKGGLQVHQEQDGGREITLFMFSVMGVLSADGSRIERLSVDRFIRIYDKYDGNLTMEDGTFHQTLLMELNDIPLQVEDPASEILSPVGVQEYIDTYGQNQVDSYGLEYKIQGADVRDHVLKFECIEMKPPCYPCYFRSDGYHVVEYKDTKWLEEPERLSVSVVLRHVD